MVSNNRIHRKSLLAKNGILASVKQVETMQQTMIALGFSVMTSVHARIMRKRETRKESEYVRQNRTR